MHMHVRHESSGIARIEHVRAGCSTESTTCTNDAWPCKAWEDSLEIRPGNEAAPVACVQSDHTNGLDLGKQRLCLNSSAQQSSRRDSQDT